MSELGEEEALGEQSPKPMPGEGVKPEFPTIIQEKHFTFEEASKCLNTLGKDESGMRYAYLKMSATERKLTDIRMVLNFPHLLFIDVSGNYLTVEALQILADMPYVIQIKAQRNFVHSAVLNEMTYLQDLSLARNQITDTLRIKQPILEYLDLNYNQIYTVQFQSDDLPELKQLELRGNNLFEFGGAFPESIEKLYLAENRIARIIQADVGKLRNLQYLHLRNNLIHKLDGFTSDLVNLKYLNLRQNKIRTIKQFRKLQQLPSLHTLIMAQNPVSGDDEKEKDGDDPDEEDWAEADGEDKDNADDPNRISLLVLLPALIRINKTPVSYEEREEAKEGKYEKYLEIMDQDSSDDEYASTTENTTGQYLTDLETADMEHSFEVINTSEAQDVVPDLQVEEVEEN